MSEARRAIPQERPGERIAALLRHIALPLIGVVSVAVAGLIVWAQQDTTDAGTALALSIALGLAGGAAVGSTVIIVWRLLSRKKR